MPQNTVIGGGTAMVSMLLRTAQTSNRSPSGTWVTICMARICTASAAAFFSGSVVAAMKLSRSFSISGSHGQPARALSQVLTSHGVITGSRMSSCTQLVPKPLQPPSEGGPLLEAQLVDACDSLAHDTHDTATRHADNATMGEVHEHPSWKEYKWVALILTVITVVEVWVYYIPSFVASRLFIPFLLIMSAVKFAIVVMFYMHLKYDHKLFRALFTGPLIIAILTLISLMFLFGHLAIRAG